MTRPKLEELTIKDIILSAFAVLIAVIGYFINARLSSIDESLKEFSQFQKSQIEITARILGDINLLKAKDTELEKKIDDNKNSIKEIRK